MLLIIRGIRFLIPNSLGTAPSVTIRLLCASAGDKTHNKNKHGHFSNSRAPCGPWVGCVVLENIKGPGFQKDTHLERVSGLDPGIMRAETQFEAVCASAAIQETAAVTRNSCWIQTNLLKQMHHGAGSESPEKKVLMARLEPQVCKRPRPIAHGAICTPRIKRCTAQVHRCPGTFRRHVSENLEGLDR